MFTKLNFLKILKLFTFKSKLVRERGNKGADGKYNKERAIKKMGWDWLQLC